MALLEIENLTYLEFPARRQTFVAVDRGWSRT
jgi:hypothetical protein